MVEEVEMHKVRILPGAPCVFGHPLPLDVLDAQARDDGAVVVRYVARPGTGRWGRSLARLVPAPDAPADGVLLRRVVGREGLCAEVLTEEIEIDWPADDLTKWGEPEQVGKPEWVKSKGRGKGTPKYPFGTMAVGGTFQVPPGPDQPKWSSFRVYCINKGREIGKKFLYHKHPDGTFEVYRQS